MTLPVAVSANLLVGRSARTVREGVADHLAHGAAVVAFQEASGYLGIIGALARTHGYREPIHAAAKAGKGMDSSVLLVARGVPFVASGTALVRAPWVGPRLRIRWPGRGIPWAVVALGTGGLTLVASVHPPTGRNGDNARAFRRYMRRLRRLARKKARQYGATKVLYLGDWNCPVGARDKRSVRRLLAKRIGAHVVNCGARPPIDYAVTHLDLRGETGPRHGSDHDSIRLYWKAA